MFAGAPDRTGDEHAAPLSDHQSASLMKQSMRGATLEIGPELVGALDQRDVMWMLVVRLADDSRQPVGRSQVMGWSEAIEARDANAALCQVIQRGAPHRPKADDDYIGGMSHWRWTLHDHAAAVNHSALPMLPLARRPLPSTTGVWPSVELVDTSRSARLCLRYATRCAAPSRTRALGARHC